MDTLAKSIKKVISQIETTRNGQRGVIYSEWSKIVGKSFAKHSCPADLENKTLFINVTNSAWMYMLRLRQQQILEKIKRIAQDEKIQAIKLRIGNLF